MLPKQHRLKKKKDFDLVFKQGKGASAVHFFLKYYKNNLNIPRVGFICAKKTAKKAVERNRIKRYLREAVRCFLPLMRQDNDLIILAKPGSVSLDFHQIKDEINWLFKKASLMK